MPQDPGGSGGFDALAAIGAATGVLALGWNILSRTVERERVMLSFFVYEFDDECRTAAIVAVTITNVGRRPASLVELGTAATMPLSWRAPIIGRMTFRNRRRFARLFRCLGTASITKQRDWTPHRRLDPGEIEELTLTSVDANAALETGTWAVLQTGVARYVAPLIDNRPTAPRHNARISDP